jgi:WD40 repeat protein/tRNA A-37 threonylcarbamoyl transferase component Bud32
MTAAVDCPDLAVLEQLAVGAMAPAEVERLAQHCEQCVRCVGLLHGLRTKDTLVEAMASLRTPPESAADPVVAELIVRLKRTPPPVGPALLQEGDLTAGPTPPTHSTGDTPSPDISHQRPEATQELYAFLSPAQGPGELGRLGPYRVLEVLGAGGMGVVFLAEDPQLKRRVALKAMRPGLAARADSRERFLREARATAAVKDDHVVTIYQVAGDSGVPYLAMELLDGMPLNRWLEQVPRPAVAEVVRLGREMALGLAAAHARGLIHRDVKPGNIWLESRPGQPSAPRVKLLDFGLVRAAADDVHLTRSGAVVGTPAYMAPEQARGETVDARCDLFSLGCVLYRLLTGRKPFQGETTMALLASLATNSPAPVRELNPEVAAALSDLVMRLLAKDPAARPASARAVADELDAVGREPAASPKRSGRRRLLTVAGGLCAAAALVAGIVVIIRDRQGREVARVVVPDGGSVDIKKTDDSRGGPAKKEPSVVKPGVTVRPVSLTPLPLPFEPLSAAALVRQPLRLPKVSFWRGWDIEFKEGVGGGIKQFAWSPGGQTVAVLNDDNRVSLLSVDTGQTLAELKDASGPLAWSPDGNYLATAGPDPGVLVWDAGGNGRRAVTDGPGAVQALAWAPDGKRLVSVGGLHVSVFDPVKGERVGLLGPMPDAPRAVTWSPDGKLVACNVPAVGWYFWDVAQKKLVNDPKQWQAIALEFAPDSRSALVTASDLSSYRLLDVVSGRQLGNLSAPRDKFFRPAGTWSPDGNALALPRNGGVELWRASLRQQLSTLPTGGVPPRQVAFSADGQLLMALAGDRLYLFETDSRRLRGILLPGKGYHGLTISPEGFYMGDEQVERDMLIRMRQMDGNEAVMKPAVFEQRYGFKNRADAVHLLRPLPENPPPAEGQPLGPLALVRVPAAVPEAVTWTVETCSARYAAGAVAYRPDGKLLAAGGQDGTIRLWDPKGGKLVRMLVGYPVVSLAWSPDGRILAAASGNGYPHVLWDPATGRLLRRIDRARSPDAARVAWAPSGTTLAVADGFHILLWDAATERTRLFGFPAETGALAWSPDAKTLALGTGTTMRLWDVDSAKEVAKLEAPAGWFIGVAWSPDGKRLLTAQQAASAAVLWDAATAKPLRQIKTEAAFYGSMPFAWSADGKRILLGTNRKISLIDAESGERAQTFEDDSGVRAVALAPDGAQVATASQFNVRLHKVATGERAHTLETTPSVEDITSLALAPDGSRLAYGPKGPNLGRLHVLATATGQSLLAPEATGPAAWSPDGKLFAAAGPGGVVSLSDGGSMQQLRWLEGGDRQPRVDVLAWSADGQRLVVGRRESFVAAYAVATGKRLWRADNQPLIMGAAWSPNGKGLAVSRARAPVQFFDGATGNWRGSFWNTFILDPVWSPDGRTLAGSNGGHESLVIDADSGTTRAKLVGSLSHWSADGRRLATCSLDGQTVYVSDAATGKRLSLRTAARFPGPIHSGEIRRAWSPDGSVLAFTNGFQIQLCDGGGWLLGTLLPGAPYERLVIRPDGHYRGTARVDRELRMVVLKTDGTSETLTPDEFERHYGWHNDPAQVHLTD